MRFPPIKPPQLQLRPLVYEVPHSEGRPLFVGRGWLFTELESVLNGDAGGGSGGPSRPGGGVIVGGMGSGKTAVIEQLVEHSSFGDTGSERTFLDWTYFVAIVPFYILFTLFEYIL